jgi:23S rRNA (adenine2503-C2)-methyltransferase
MDDSVRKPSLLGLLPHELEPLMEEFGQPRYRARQVFTWLQRGAPFRNMTDLPQALRDRLAERAGSDSLAPAGRDTTADGAAKFGFRTHDGHVVETVLIPHVRRTTVCVSSQIGCAFACSFCATGRMGLIRDLAASEIVEQVVRAGDTCRPKRVSNVVFMGMGEPLANYDATMSAVRVFNHPNGLGIGARHIAISTCGIPDAIRRLAGEGIQVALAISLHAATDDVRRRLLPVAHSYTIAEVISAARLFVHQTGRKVAFQYVVIPDVNDTQKQAQRLAELLHGLPSMVNVIPRSPVGESTPRDDRAAPRFAKLLRKQGMPVAVRRSRGAEALAACGQLGSGEEHVTGLG